MKLKLSEAAYVLFTEDREAQCEVYLCADENSPGFGYRGPFSEAIKFGDAASAYAYGKRYEPYLDNWRVGLRNGSV